MSATVQSNFVPTIWTARFIQALNDNFVHASRANRNYEGEIRAAGDTVKIPSATLTPTIRDYAADTDISNPELFTGDSQDLVINQQKYFNLYVDDIDAVQSRPELMSEAMRLAAVQVAKQVDTFNQGLFVGAFNAARRVTDTTDGDAVSDGHTEAFIELKQKMSEANIPEGGRWAIVPPLVVARLEKYLLAQGSNSAFTPASSDEALRNGFVGRLLGFDLFVTNVVNETGSGDSTKVNIIASQGAEALTYAQQIAEIEAYRPEKRFGDAVKGLYVYGGKIVRPNFVWQLQVDKA